MTTGETLYVYEKGALKNLVWVEW